METILKTLENVEFDLTMLENNSKLLGNQNEYMKKCIEKDRKNIKLKIDKLKHIIVIYENIENLEFDLIVLEKNSQYLGNQNEYMKKCIETDTKNIKLKIEKLKHIIAIYETI